MPTRRDFLKSSTLFGATFCCSSALTQVQTIEPSKLLRVQIPQILQGQRMSQVPPMRIDIPDVGEFKVLKGDFHVHTIFSDGHVMPKNRVLEAVNNGFDVIALTDHIEYPNLELKNSSDFNRPYNLAKPEADRRNLLLVRGAEITKKTFPPGHFNALFVKDVNAIAAVVDDWRKMLQVAAEQEAFLLWNHPGWVAPGNGGIEEGQPMSFSPEHEEIYQKGWMHGIECFNYTDYYPIVSDWCNEKDLTIMANSDIHASETDWYGFQNRLRPMNLILVKERTVESVKEAFFAKRVIACAGGNLWGRKETLELLFDACVNIEKTASGRLKLTNRSDLPCMIAYAGKSNELVAQGTVEFVLDPNRKTFSVLNWVLGTYKPLERNIA